MRRCAAWAILLCACGTDDANVAGNYTVALTNRDNGCNIGNWTVGGTANVDVTLTQSKADVTATVMGAAGLGLDVLLGAHVYTGTVSGSHVDLKIFGTRSQTMNNCSFTLTSEITASIHGDILMGTNAYRAMTNGSPDCATIENCVSSQDFNGTRPPK